MKKIQKFFTILLFSIFYFLVSGYCQAAVLYLEPSQGEYYRSDNFVIKIKIDTEGECINTVKADLSFPIEFLKVIDFSEAGSFLNVWIQPASIDKGKGIISFIGGTPGGFCGILAGDSGEANLLGKIIFEVKDDSIGTAEIKILGSSQVLLNDGLGTTAELKNQGAIFHILEGIPEATKREWQIELAKDKTPPEPFTIRIVQDPILFEGKYFIIFSAIDKQTGIDYYEIKEGKKEWEKAVSPYLLEDQSLKSIIKVRAVDKAGNERIIEYKPSVEVSFRWLLFSALIIIGWIIFRFIKRLRVPSL